jgi:hypothetical protein
MGYFLAGVFPDAAFLSDNIFHYLDYNYRIHSSLFQKKIHETGRG